MGKSTGLYSCPSCQAPMTFRSPLTRLNVCRSCGKVAQLLESDDLIPDQTAVITESNDSLTIGSRGVVEGKKFEVLGRFRLWLDESVLNYWTILVEGSALCLLAEGYGMYAVLRRIKLDKLVSVQELHGLGSGSVITLKDGAAYLVQSEDKCWRFDIEGEVWMPACNASFPVFEMNAIGQKHLTIIEFLPGMVVPYETRYVDAATLGLTGLNTTALKPLTLKCGPCGQSIVVKTFPFAQSCSCINCGTRFSFKQGTARQGSTDLVPNTFLSSGKDKVNENNMAIPLGSTGVVKGIPYEVIGYAKKSEMDDASVSWKEYVLYNRERGYAFLSEFAGNWILVRQKGDVPVVRDKAPTSIYFKGRKYQLYNRYKIRIVDTAGEFPYDAFGGKAVESAEFIAPEQMWISEQTQGGIVEWYFGEHVDRDELAKAFPYKLPPQTESAILAPGGFDSMTPMRLLQVTVIAMAVLIAVHFLIGATRQDRTLIDKEVSIADSVGSMSLSSSTFQLNQWRSNLEFDIDAHVDNTWMEMEASLIDAHDGTEYAVDQPVEYYHGYDDGESWSEGSQTETAWINSVPAGSYYLRLHLSRDSTKTTGSDIWNSGSTSCHVIVRNDVPNHRNLWIFLGLLSLYPIIRFIQMFIAEKKRWAGSPFSPYNVKE